jgi:hypothetical protein
MQPVRIRRLNRQPWHYQKKMLPLKRVHDINQ